MLKVYLTTTDLFFSKSCRQLVIHKLQHVHLGRKVSFKRDAADSWNLVVGHQQQDFVYFRLCLVDLAVTQSGKSYLVQHKYIIF